MNDETAEVNASVTGTNGVAQDYSGQVERDGLVWIQNMTLTPGTNQIAITAADGAGQSVTTNIVVVRSTGVTVTIDDVAAWQLKQPRVTLTGTVSDSSYSVWANGIQASVTSGVWTASNVPVPPGGMAAFTVVAIPPGGNTTPGGGSTGDPADPNPGDPGSVQSSIQPETGSWVKPIRKTWTRTDSWDSDLEDYIYMQTGKATYNESTTWEWSEAGGGYGITVGSITYPEWLFSYNPDNWTIKIWVSPAGIGRCEMTWSWREGGSYTTTNMAEFGDVWLQYAISEAPSKGKWGLRETFSDDSGGIISYTKREERWASATDQELSTGGIGGVERESVIRIAASKAVKLPNGDFTNVPPTQVSVTGFGVLNTNASVDRPKPDNSKGAIDLDASADSYIRKPISNTGKYRLVIMRGTTDVTGKTIKAIVGEPFLLSAAISGGDLNLTNATWIWTIPDYAISNYGPSPAASQLGTNISKTNQSVAFRWANGGGKTVSCTVSTEIGELRASTAFSVVKPSWSFTSQTTSDNPPLGVSDIGDGTGIRLHAGSGINWPGSLGIRWQASATMPTNYAGYLGLIQLVNSHYRYLQTNSQTIVASSRGAFYIDEHETNGVVTAFYQGAIVGIQPGATGSLPALLMQDTPQSGALDTETKRVEAMNQFKTYLVFKSSQAGSCWVTLSKMDWHWSGAAERNPTNGLWLMSGTATNMSINPVGHDSSEFPTWTFGPSSIVEEIE